MEIKFIKKLPEFCKKYKYAFLIFLIGIILMLFPGNKGKQTTEVTHQETVVTQLSLEERLAAILSQVEGAGEVQVVLTLSAGEETLFQYDEDSSQGEKEQVIRKDTVIISDASRNEAGLVKQVIPAVYRGAMIVCQGADNPSVRLEIVDAVSKLTGLGANCISVLKMK